MGTIDGIKLNQPNNIQGANSTSETKSTETKGVPEASFDIKNSGTPEDDLAVYIDTEEAQTEQAAMTDEEYEAIVASIKSMLGNQNSSDEEIPLASSVNTVSTGNAVLDALYFQQQLLLNEQQRLNTQIANKEKQKAKLTSKLNANSDSESDSSKSLQSRISKLESEIGSLNSELSTCKSNIQSIITKIQQAYSDAASGVSSTDGVNASASSSSVYTGSGTGQIPSDLAQRLDEKLGEGFAAKVEDIASKLNCDPNNLLAMMYSESGIDPHCVAYNGAVGLCMFMPSVLAGKGYSSSQVASMSGVEQLDLVYEFLHESKTSFVGLSDSDVLDGGTLYAMNFLPAFAKNEVLCSSGDIYYNTNYPLDLDGDGNISKTDLAKRLQSKFDELYQWF